MVRKFGLVAAGAVAILSLAASPATATIIGTTTAPLNIVSGGSEVIFGWVYSNAGDTDVTMNTGAGTNENIFNNHAGTPEGNEVILPAPVTGLIDLQMTNMATSSIYDLYTTSSDTYYHAIEVPDCATVALGGTSYGSAGSQGSPGALPADICTNGALVADLANLPSQLGTGYDVAFLGWEDLNGYDYDYNDLVMFVAWNPNRVENNPTPEPLTLSLFGAGLAGAAAMRRRRKSAK